MFTPFEDERLDLPALEQLLDAWLADAAPAPGPIAGGGALVTGLAAAAPNAGQLVALIRDRVPTPPVATAADPLLESWASFMDNAARLSQRHPAESFLNLDIGGGTTNLALGRAGEVSGLGCLQVGARHLRVDPTGSRLVGRSAVGKALLDELLGSFAPEPGQSLPAPLRDRLLDELVGFLEEAVAGRDPPASGSARGRLVDRWLPLPAAPGPLRVVYSGGVGELVYRVAAKEALPPDNSFGDLGVLLARRIAASPRLARDLASHRPEAGGRATLLGLTLASSSVSGATLFLPRPGVLPLRDVPIVGRFEADSPISQLCEGIARARRFRAGACLQLAAPEHARGLKALGGALAAALGAEDPLLVLLVDRNVGKALGGYATRWGRAGSNLVVIDQVPDRRARFVTLGELVEGVVPVTFHGLEPPERD